MHPNDGRVVSNFIMQARRGDPITLYGDGQQTRSFCFVDDLIAGMLALMASADGVTGPINLGNPVELTIQQLAEAVCSEVGVEGAIEYQDLPSDDPLQRQPDISLAREILGWEPGIALQTGLEKTVAYFRGLQG